MFDKKSDIARFLAVAEAGAITLAADRLAMTQPALTRVIERIERRLGGRLFERMPTGVRLTALGAALAAPARGILREYDAASQAVDAARSGAIGRFRVTAAPVWTEAILARAIPRFWDAFPGIELRLETTSRLEGLRRLEGGEADLHCGGLDRGERLPKFLRRHRFPDMTTGIVAWDGHPLLAGDVTAHDLCRYPWLDYEAATPPDGPQSLGALLERLHETTHTRVKTILRTGSAGLLLLAGGPWLARLPIDFLDRLPGLVLRPLPVEFGRYRYRTGFVARRSAEELPPFRRFEAILRDTALGRRG